MRTEDEKEGKIEETKDEPQGAMKDDKAGPRPKDHDFNGRHGPHGFAREDARHGEWKGMSKLKELGEAVRKWEEGGRQGPHPAQRLFEERGRFRDAAAFFDRVKDWEQGDRKGTHPAQEWYEKYAEKAAHRWREGHDGGGRHGHEERQRERPDDSRSDNFAKAKEILDAVVAWDRDGRNGPNPAERWHEVLFGRKHDGPKRDDTSDENHAGEVSARKGKAEERNKHEKELAELQRQLLDAELKNLKLAGEVRDLNEQYMKKVVEKASEAQKLVDKRIDELQKDFSARKAEAEKYALAKGAAQLVELLQNFEMVLTTSQKAGEAVKAYAQGFQIVFDMFKDAIADLGITEIPVAVGDSYDHATMEALDSIKVEGSAPNLVAEVVRKGYRLHDKVVTHAVVRTTA